MTLNGFGPVFLHSPRKSTGTTAKELSMSKTTVWRVLGQRLVFLVINVCNHGERYETPCIMWTQNIMKRPVLCRHRTLWNALYYVDTTLWNTLYYVDTEHSETACVMWTQNIMKRPVLCGHRTYETPCIMLTQNFMKHPVLYWYRTLWNALYYVHTAFLHMKRRFW